MSVTNLGTAVVTNAGGIGVIAIDSIAKTRLELVELSAETKQKLKEVLPSSASLGNPIDILGDALAIRYQQVLEILGESGEIGSVIVILTPQVVTQSLETAKFLVDFSQKYPTVVIVPVFIGGKLVKEAKDVLQNNKLPFYDTPETAINSLNHLYEYSLYESVRFQKNNRSESLLKNSLDSLDKAKIAKIRQKLSSVKSKNLDYETILEMADSVLIKPMDSDSDFKITDFLAKHPNGIAAKVVDGDILHRTERKMVQVGLKSKQEVVDFIQEFSDLKPQIALQEMIICDRLEAFIGVNFDEQFGYTFVAGSGGIYAEVYKDFILGPIPTGSEEIFWYLKKTNIHKFFDGYRNKFFDEDKYIQSIYKLTLLVQIFPQIQSIDVNPYIATKTGGKIVDFKVILK
jgi:acyl-CoA synthetase (NDP forming)